MRFIRFALHVSDFEISGERNSEGAIVQVAPSSITRGDPRRLEVRSM